MFPSSSFVGSAARAFKPAPPATRKHPCEIDFLSDDFSASVLDDASRRARELGVGAQDLLIAEGRISENDYSARLAQHLDVDLGRGPFDFDARADWRMALRAGVIRLGDGRWLIAPRGAVLTELVQRLTPARARAHFVVAAPGDFERGVFRRFGRAIAIEAAERLAREEPQFCARAGGSFSQKWLAFFVFVLLPAELALGLTFWAAALIVVAAIMCVAVLVRIAATFASLQRAVVPRALTRRRNTRSFSSSRRTTAPPAPRSRRRNCRRTSRSSWRPRAGRAPSRAR